MGVSGCTDHALRKLTYGCEGFITAGDSDRYRKTAIVREAP